jgi:hypothetical protein
MKRLAAGGVVLASLVMSGCLVTEDRAHESSADAPRVRGRQVAALFTRPVKPALRFGNARSAHCRFLQKTPGQGGRWVYWRCQLAIGAGSTPVLVAWQLDGADEAPAIVNARDERTGARRDNCCIDHPGRAKAHDVEALFTEPYETLLGPGGVVAAGCHPRADATGLGNPWRCTLDLDSDPKTRVTVTVSANGAFRSSGEGHGCCLQVSPVRRGRL